jgi:plastocyanin
MRIIGAAAVILVVAGCAADEGGSSPRSSPSTVAEASPTLGEPGCEPSDADVTVTAVDLSFDLDCITVDAGTPLAVELINREEAGSKERHNFSVTLQDNTSVFEGELIPPGASVSNEIGSLDAGDYYFVCDTHPSTMLGDLYVR